MARLTKEEQKRKDELLAKGLKECGNCGRVLPVEQFSKNKRSRDGLNSKCKECDYISTKQYNQEHIEEKQQYQRQYHKQYDKQHQPQYYQTPQGQVVRFNNNAKRRKREEEQGVGLTKEQWLEMMQFFDFKCAYSDIYIGGKENKGIRSIDHIIPLVKGGEHEVWNCVPMDKSLNSSKCDKDMMEWYTAQDFYSKEKLDKILAWQQYAYNKWSTKEKV